MTTIKVWNRLVSNWVLVPLTDWLFDQFRLAQLKDNVTHKVSNPNPAVT